MQTVQVWIGRRLDFCAAVAPVGYTPSLLLCCQLLIPACGLVAALPFLPNIFSYFLSRRTHFRCLPGPSRAWVPTFRSSLLLVPLFYVGTFVFGLLPFFLILWFSWFLWFLWFIRDFNHPLICSLIHWLTYLLWFTGIKRWNIDVTNHSFDSFIS